MEKLHDALFSGLVDSCHAQDTKLQEVIYRFRHYTPEDFGLKKGFQCDIVEARDTLRRVTLKKTPLDMLLVLKTSIDQLTKAMMQNVKLRRLDVEAYPLTTDEILDQLLFVLVQVCNQCMQETKAGMASSFPIAAVMEYITKYHFINSNTTALGFTLATFQVAVEYFLMRDVCKEYDLHGETSCSLTIQESKCVQAAHKIRHDLMQAEKKVELARQKSVDDSKQDDFNEIVSNTSDSGRRAYIIGDWSTGNEDIDASKSANTDGCVPSEVGIHPVKFSIGGKLMSASDSSLTHLSSGQRFFAASTEHGGLFTWGDSSGGRLGFVIADGESRRVTIPRRVSALQQHTIIQVACGGFHSLVTDLNGHVFAWGSNSRGQLGFSFSKTESGAFATPSVVADLRGVYVRSVACGEYHSLALSSDGRVFSWGCNRFGKLGRVAKDLLDMAQPRQVDADWTGWDMDMKTKIESGAQNIAVCRIAAGKDHSLAISGEGVGFTWGRGDSGQLGHGCYMDVSEPKQVMAITPSILDFCKLIDVAGGSNFSLFLSQNGTVFITGSDPSQDVESMYLSPTLLTLPMTLELKYFGRIASISCGEAHYALLSTSGALLLSNSSFFDPSLDAGIATAEVQERRVVWFKEAGIVCRMVCGASHTLVVV
ncbi:hypothetical protein CCR75_008078 [Bremia lactucae]|uniref:VPS9 domain-containing protein n=1 Tax=Bremia lactucae TaxID=4779 RepID=A0A976ILD3_BRELC|nr:hypothetical protein CCR75_008078 [Bremia lactucae]